MITIIVLSLILFLVVIYKMVSHNFIQEKEKKVDELDQIITIFLDYEGSIDKLKEITGIDDVDSLIIFGEESDFSKELTNEQIKTYELNEYVLAQEMYAKRVEKLLNKNIEYDIIDTRTGASNEIIKTIELRSFYYDTLVNDITELAFKIMTEMGRDLRNYEQDESIQIDYYKAKIKAMEIISSYFEEYYNESETVTVEVSYVDGKIKDSVELNNLFTYLSGMGYENMDYLNLENIENMKKRVDEYYSEALRNNQFNEEDVLKLK